LGLRRAVPIFYFLFPIFLFCLVAGCGAPGEPAERKSPIPVAVTDLAASQQGDDVILTFTLPKESIERKPLKALPTVEIYRFFTPHTGASNSLAPPARDAALLVTIPPEMVGHFANREQFRYVDSLIAENFSQNRGNDAAYFVRTRTSSKKVSADSNLVVQAIQPAADPISDLKAEVTRAAIVLTWSPPQRTLVGAAPPIATYSVFRAESDPPQAGSTNTKIATNTAPTTAKVASTDTEPAPLFTHLADTPTPPFQDLQIQFGKQYIYSVRSVVQYDQLRIESADSNLATVVRLDSFLPTAPEDLIAALIPADDHNAAYFDLSWSISPDNDIAGYNIYRKEGTGTGRTKLNTALLLTPAFRDMNVFPGRLYVYVVTAVNRAGNESPDSAPVSGNVPEAGTPAESH